MLTQLEQDRTVEAQSLKNANSLKDVIKMPTMNKPNLREQSETPIFPGGEWERRSPKAMGLRPAVVAQISDRMKISQANGVLICKGYLVAQWNYGGPSDTRFSGYSVGKSITGLVLGLALRDGLIPNLDVPVKNFYPAFAVGRYSDEITFRQLVTCSSGIALRLKRFKSGCFVDPDDMKPGLECRYHNDHFNELGKALTYIYGEDMENILRSHVLVKIGADMNWGDEKEETGVHLADGRAIRLAQGCGATHWTAADLARVGWLYANNGNWEGETILPRGYVEECMRVNPSPVMEYRAKSRYEHELGKNAPPYDANRNLTREEGLAYGLAWWGYKTGNGTWVWHMSGSFGQACMVWPERGIVLTKLNAPKAPSYITARDLWPLVLNLPLL